MSEFVQSRNDSEQATSEASHSSPRANFAEYFAVVGLGPVELQQQVKDTKIGSSPSLSNLNELKHPADTKAPCESTGRNRSNSLGSGSYGNAPGDIF